jgi:hypothetical protein
VIVFFSHLTSLSIRYEGRLEPLVWFNWVGKGPMSVKIFSHVLSILRYVDNKKDDSV